MAHRIIRTLATILALTFLSQTLALGQDQPTPAPPPAVDNLHTWDHAQSWALSAKNILVITMAQPTHRIACRVQSFTVDQLACKSPFGKSRIYKPQEVAALTTPSDDGFKLRFVLALNGVAAAAIWGTVVLASTCIPCAVATGVAALLFFGAAGAVLIGDDQPETLLYLAPGQKLQLKGYIEEGHQSR